MDRFFKRLSEFIPEAFFSEIVFFSYFFTKVSTKWYKILYLFRKIV